MKFWCKKHKKIISGEGAKKRCLLENNPFGCINLIKKRRKKKFFNPKAKRQPTKGEMLMTETLNKTELALFHFGLLPINSKTGEGTILRELIDNQWKLLRCLQSAHAGVCLILRNGTTIRGSLYRVDQSYNKLRIKTGESNQNHGIGTFMDTWPREIIAVQFKTDKNFNELEFSPYQEKQKRYIDISRNDLNETEQGLFWDKYDLLNYLLHGKYCVDEVGIVLANGVEFVGSLELVRSDHVLLSLLSSGKFKTYLDIHPLMISAVRFEVGSQGWPYDPGEC